MPNKEREIQFNDGQAIQMARFIAELEKQGIFYSVRDLAGGWAIEIIGPNRT